VKEICAIVNARVGSSRVHQKMIRPYAGTTLIDIALEKLNKCGFFSHRYLAASEETLTERVSSYDNIEVLSRNNDSVLPGPHHPTITFEHYLRLPTGPFFVINPCCAFLTIETIESAFHLFQNTDYQSYISAQRNRDWIFSSEGEPLTHRDSSTLQNTSDGAHRLKVNHAFYISRSSRFKNENGRLWSLTVNDPHLIEINEDEAIDVDTELEFQFSEFCYSQRRDK